MFEVLGKGTDMEGSLLSHIAGNFISQYENVANSSVCYLLNRYSAAREVLKRVLDLDSIPINYVTEVSTTSNGRPDICGFDVNGKKTVIIEGKFWANLTGNQPGSYLKELADGGKLIFLAPERRLDSLDAEIQKRLGRKDERVVLKSWIAFLDLVEVENSKAHDGDLASDLVQLRDLCARMDEEGMPPLSVSDLDPMNGRICYQLADLIDGCNPLLKEWDQSDFTGSKSAGFKLGFGFFFKAYGMNCWLGFQAQDWFTRPSHTPIWLHISQAENVTMEAVYCTMNDCDAENSYSKNGRAEYAIVLKAGMDRSQAIGFIVKEVKRVLAEIQRRLGDNAAEDEE